MMKWLYNRWIKHKTKNYTQIPLFTMVFNMQEYQKDNKSKNCYLYLHPELAKDVIIQGKCKEIVDYVRANYDMERFMKI